MEGLLEKMAWSIEDITLNQDQTMKMVCEIAARMGLPEVEEGRIAAQDRTNSATAAHQRMGQNGKELRQHAAMNAATDNQPRPPAIVEADNGSPDNHATRTSVEE